MNPTSCYHCGSSQIVRNGRTTNGKQRFVCRECGRCLRAQRTSNGYSEERKAEILRAYHERTSLRGLSRIFGVSRNTVSSWLKKSPLSTTVGANTGSGSSGGYSGVR